MKTKNISIISILLCLTFLMSCEDFLDREPYGKVTLEDLTESDRAATLSSKLFEAYSQLRHTNVSGRPLIAMFCTVTDDADKGAGPTTGTPWIQLKGFTFTADNAFNEWFYTGNFTGITYTNSSIALIDSLLAPNDPAKSGLIAESRFLRGFYYYNLLRAYGGVPIVDKVMDQGAPTPPRATELDLAKFIEDDLIYAKDSLPLKSEWEPKWAGRATSGAARAYLAKLYLKQKRWQDVYTMTSEIIASGEYNLNTPYNEIFLEKNENGSESVFEVQCETTGTVNANCEYAQFQGIRGSDLDLGDGFNNPSQALINAYEPGDPRKNMTVIFRGETLSDGVTIPTSATNPYYNKKVYQWKFEKDAHPIRPFGGWINVRLVRYAEVILMHAEAANELGKTDEALADLEMIRARARGGNMAVLPQITVRDKTALFNAIAHERRIELALEHERYQDLLRWGIAETVLGSKWVKGKHELYPIPQKEIDKSNGILVQNPGY